LYIVRCICSGKSRTPNSAASVIISHPISHLHLFIRVSEPRHWWRTKETKTKSTKHDPGTQFQLNSDFHAARAAEPGAEVEPQCFAGACWGLLGHAWRFALFFSKKTLKLFGQRSWGGFVASYCWCPWALVTAGCFPRGANDGAVSGADVGLQPCVNHAKELALVPLLALTTVLLRVPRSRSSGGASYRC
jgi:hypothetical protein